MVHLQKSLLFPNITFQSEAQFKSWGSGSDKTTRIYKLDWNPIDKIKEDRWLKQCANTADDKFPGTLPDEYNDWVKGMPFAIPEDYLAEIRRTARLAQTEWGTDRSFDTMVREICLQPAVEYSYVAFRLLADCLYDASANYFYRGPDKLLATQALLYKFWSFQTGRGLVKDHAHFDKIEWHINEAIIKRRVFLMSLQCTCGEKAFVETSSEGWKLNINDADVVCSCGKKLLTNDNFPISRHTSSVVLDSNNNDSTKSQVKRFLNAIDNFEKSLEPEKKEALGPYVTPLCPVKVIKFNKANESVVTQLKKQGYVDKDNRITIPVNSQHSSALSFVDEESGTVVKVIKKTDDPANIMTRKEGSIEEQQAFKEAYNAQVDPITEHVVPKDWAAAGEASQQYLKESLSSGPSINTIAEGMFMDNLKKGLKDLRPELKVLINGMPVMKLNVASGTSEKDVIKLVMKKKEIKKYTQGKELKKTIYQPDYFISLVFDRPSPKKGKRKKK